MGFPTIPPPAPFKPHPVGLNHGVTRRSSGSQGLVAMPRSGALCRTRTSLMPRGVSRWDFSMAFWRKQRRCLPTKRNNRPWARWGCINVKTACSMKYLPEMNWLEPEATMFEDVWREDYFWFFLGCIISIKSLILNIISGLICQHVSGSL